MRALSGELGAKKGAGPDTRVVCGVVPVMHAGKSTLLNALVGRELLPMNNVPETARICKIVHNANTEPYLQEPPAPDGSAKKAASAKEPTVSSGIFRTAHEPCGWARQRLG